MIEQKDSGIIVEIKVKPKRPKFRISLLENRIIIETKAPAENNKANEEILKELEKLFKNKVIILKGKKLTRKTLFIERITQEEFHRLLRDHA